MSEENKLLYVYRLRFIPKEKARYDSILHPLCSIIIKDYNDHYWEYVLSDRPLTEIHCDTRRPISTLKSNTYIYDLGYAVRNEDKGLKFDFFVDIRTNNVFVDWAVGGRPEILLTFLNTIFIRRQCKLIEEIILDKRRKIE